MVLYDNASPFPDGIRMTNPNSQTAQQECLKSAVYLRRIERDIHTRWHSVLLVQLRSFVH